MTALRLATFLSYRPVLGALALRGRLPRVRLDLIPLPAADALLAVIFAHGLAA